MATRAANDLFREYYQERLWEWIPAIYREEDGLAENPGVLRALVELFATQAAMLRRSQDRLWEDQFVELADNWAVPYIGDLVGTRMVSALNPRGRRVDVAKTIYYRRRAGTLRVLEELIGDIAGWDGVVVEEFRRLARARHGLDPPPAPYAGRFTQTPPGGTADLRNTRGAALSLSPFDEYHHTPDIRRNEGGLDGRRAIPKLALHIYRVPAWEVEGVMPRQSGAATQWTFDPSGRDIPLYQPRNRPADWDQWRGAREWELPAPMRCRVLGHEEFEITLALIAWLRDNAALSAAAATELLGLLGVRFPNEARMRETLGSMANSVELLAFAVFDAIRTRAIVADCGKSGLLPLAMRIESAPGANIAPQRIGAGNLSAWSAAMPNRDAVVDPDRGRVRFLNAPPAPGVRFDYNIGFPAPIGAGPWDRNPATATVVTSGGGAVAAPSSGVAEISDSATYSPVADVPNITNLTLQAADQQRPYLRATGAELVLTGTGGDSVLLLDGLWIGGDGPLDLVLDGEWQSVTLRHVTLDPGGTDSQGAPIGAVRLLVRGSVDHLIISSSITSQIAIDANGVVERLSVEDSIVARHIVLPLSTVELTRSTLLGALFANRLSASEALITGRALITDTQNGCFRFSAAAPSSRTPHPYESHFLAGLARVFVSTDYGNPRYMQLSLAAPVELLRGAADGSEIGAYSSLRNPIKLDSLQAKIGEYAPFGLIPLFVFES
jgi:hypothetical protein